MLDIAAKSSAWIWCVIFTCSVSFGQTTVHLRPDNIPGAVTALTHLADSTTVQFAAGTYHFAKPITLPPRLHSVILEAEPGAKVVLSAGQLISGWKPSTFNGHACWAAYLPAVRLGLVNFRELWVNDIRATRARYPAAGYLSSVEPADDKIPWNQGQFWFGYKPGDLPDQLPSETEAIVMNRWEDSRLPIASIDPAIHRVTSARRTVFTLQDGDLYFLEGAPQWLEHPGDWYLDCRTGYLYYIPRAGETIGKAMAVVPLHDEILQVHGATNLTIRNLIFSHSEWNLPEAVLGQEPIVGGFGQAEIGVTSAVHFENCHGCQIQSCRFEHLGNYALELGKGCQGNVIERSTFTDLGSGAIKIGETDQRDAVADQSFGNIVRDCRIIDGGHMFPSACGIWIGQSYDNIIEHNELADLFYTGISVGWTWGYGPSLARGNRIESNLIHHIGKKSNGDGPILSDMGALYTLGTRAGMTVTGNVFHDITARVYGGWGIYLDEGSSDLLAENNLIYRTTHGGFHLHYGKNNIVQNNIFAYGREVQIARSTVEDGTMLTFKHNIVCWDSGVFTQTDHNAILFDENLYQCSGDGKLRFGDQTWDQWKAAGQDVHTIEADPLFADPSHGNFTLLPQSPAESIGFQPFNIDGVGPRKTSKNEK